MSAAILRCRKPNLKGNTAGAMPRIERNPNFEFLVAMRVAFVVREIVGSVRFWNSGVGQPAPPCRILLLASE